MPSRPRTILPIRLVFALGLAFFLLLPASALDAGMNAFTRVRRVEPVPGGMLLECSVPQESTTTGWLRVRFVAPLEIRVEAALSRDSFAPLTGTATRPRLRQTRDTATLTLGEAVVVVRRDTLGLSLRSPRATIGFGDPYLGYTVAYRRDSETGHLYDFWLGLAVPQTTAVFGGFPEGAANGPLYINGREVTFLNPSDAPDGPSDVLLPVAPFFITSGRWALLLPKDHSSTLNLRGPGEIGVHSSRLDITFILADPSGLGSLFRARARTQVNAPVPPALAFDPSFSRDTYTPDTYLNLLYMRARSLDIPLNILSFEDWRHPPTIMFKRLRPGPGETYGLAALTPTRDAADTFRLMWTGSMASQFDSLRGTLRSGLSAGLSGITFWGNDLHAFLGRDGTDPQHPSPDLYQRWIQFLAFSPVMQLHGRRYTHEPWLYNDGSGLVEAYRDYSWIHVNLKPYLISEAEATRTSFMPLMRPLFLEAPGDTETWVIDDEYMLGSGLLVAPVMRGDTPARTLYLPEGEWMDFWTDGRLRGPRWFQSYPAPGDRIPVFARAGSVLPMALGVNYAPSSPVRGRPRLTLRLYPDASGRATGVVRRTGATTRVNAVGGTNSGWRIQLDQMAETCTLWIPDVTRTPARITIDGRVVEPQSSWDALSTASMGWVVDITDNRLMVKVPPARKRVVVVEFAAP